MWLGRDSEIIKNISSQNFNCDCNFMFCDSSHPNGMREDTAKTKLNEDSPKICTVCGKALRDSTKLKEHMLVHTDETPFPAINAPWPSSQIQGTDNFTD